MEVFTPPKIPVIEKVVVETVDETRQVKTLAEELNIRFGPHMPTIEDDKKPGRDAVNFPRPTRLEHPDGVRLIIIPESWFAYFYDKTGVTGPYVFTAGFLTFLLSKEWLIIEHEMVVGASLFVILTVGLKKFGPAANKYIEGACETEERLWDNWQQGTIKTLETYIALEKNNQNSLKNQSVLFDAKRENVLLQREAEFRRRQMSVYDEVKRKLDYQIAFQNAGKQFAQRHMVNWVIDNVTKGISAQQEKEALSKCIADLKALSSKRANVI